MRHLIFVYGTLLRGEVNHHLLGRAEYLGEHRSEPRFTLFALGAYPGAAPGGHTAIAGELYRVGDAGFTRLDRLEDYPRLYQRLLIASPHGRAWIYVYRGRLRDRPVIPSGDWRDLTRGVGSIQAAGVRATRDAKNRRWRTRGAEAQE
jgi:gamma-glutamylcyclotransferase (GGCT)/AIG2-like uncharacterized protein YtfP